MGGSSCVSATPANSSSIRVFTSLMGAFLQPLHAYIMEPVIESGSSERTSIGNKAVLRIRSAHRLCGVHGRTQRQAGNKHEESLRDNWQALALILVLQADRQRPVPGVDQYNAIDAADVVHRAQAGTAHKAPGVVCETRARQGAAAPQSPLCIDTSQHGLPVDSRTVCQLVGIVAEECVCCAALEHRGHCKSREYSPLTVRLVQGCARSYVSNCTMSADTPPALRRGRPLDLVLACKLPSDV